MIASNMSYVPVELHYWCRWTVMGLVAMNAGVLNFGYAVMYAAD